jgi:predicted outer membrane repeat protein
MGTSVRAGLVRSLIVAVLAASSVMPRTGILRAEGEAASGGVVGTGTPASCTSSALQTALTGGGLVTFNCGPSPVTIVSNTYVITADTTVDGGDLITLDGENLRQHFLVQTGARLTLQRLTLTRGNFANGGSIYNQGITVLANVTFDRNSASGNGGAIYNAAGGALVVNRATFSKNQVPLGVGYGGAIASLGNITVTGSLFTQNEARYGGGLFVGGSALGEVINTAFSANKAQMFGGGLYMNNDSSAITVTHAAFDNNTAASGAGLGRSGGRLTVQHASFTDNTAVSQGGALNVSGVGVPVRVVNTTFSGNVASDSKGGGIFNNGTLELVNVTLKNNTNGVFNFGTGETTLMRNSVLDNPGYLNCDGDGTPVTSNGYNHSNDNSCALAGPGDQNGLGLDPKLGPRQVSFTAFHLPLAGSPLINAATNCSLFDQRYALRPDACDIGAVEFGGLLARAYAPITVK